MPTRFPMAKHSTHGDPAMLIVDGRRSQNRLCRKHRVLVFRMDFATIENEYGPWGSSCGESATPRLVPGRPCRGRLVLQDTAAARADLEHRHNVRWNKAVAMTFGQGMGHIVVDLAQGRAQEQVSKPLIVEHVLEGVPGARAGIDEQ